MRFISNIFLLCSFIYTFGVLLFISISVQPKAKADTNHIVISQIQISAAGNANDEFVELYNPTDAAITMSGWRLSRKTAAAGATPQNLVANLSAIIEPKTYFLITHPTSSSIGIADKIYSSSTSALTTNNTISLFSDAGQTLVDKVGIGTAADFETVAFPTNPTNNQSLVRKSSSSSTPATLITGGSEALSGNGYDSDNNANDFVLLEISQPRNSSTHIIQPTSTTIPSSIPLPTITPTASPSQTPPTPTAIQTPTNTPIPTSQPSILPTNTPAVTNIPTVTPTLLLTQTPSPTAIPSITPQPTAQVIVDEKLSSTRHLICLQTFRRISIFGFIFQIPQIECRIIKL